MERPARSHLFSQHCWSNIVVLANAKVAGDVLDKMSAVTSSRPRSIMGAELMTRGMLLSRQQYGDEWRRHRRGAHEGVNIRAASALLSVQQDEALRLVHGLSSNEKADDLLLHMTRAAASTIWRALYGGPPFALEGDKTLEEITNINTELFGSFGVGGKLVDVIPALVYLPSFLAPFKKYADKFHEYSNGFFMRMSDEACRRRQTMSGDPEALNLCASLHEKKKKLEMDDKDVAWLAGTLFIAGAETSAGVLQNFVLAMLLYPDVARKAQKEIDDIVGSERMPSFEDRERLPYIEALVKEAIRWRSVAPIGLPHVATEDFDFQDYTIPKGTMLIANLWSICRDPDLFPDYDIFRPERFLTVEEGGTAPVLEPGARFEDLPFGYGRRICVARYVARNTLFIDIATLLWAFNFHKAKDANGVEVTPSSTAFHDTGVTVRPAAFLYKLVPRSDRVLSLISRAGKEEN